MTPDQKPEWFQIADADNSASPRKVVKGLPVMALVAVAAILGVGAVVAQTPDESPANATESVAPAVVESTQTPASTKTTSVASQKPLSTGVAGEESNDEPSVGPVPTIPAVPASTSASQESTAPTNSGIANPGIGKKPHGGEHEGDDDEGEDDEGEDD